MRAEYVRHPLLLPAHRLTPNALLSLCMLFATGTAFAQQVPAAGAVLQNASSGNQGAPQAESSSRKYEAQSLMPDAPSASRHLDLTGASLTLADRACIYAHSIFSPLTLVGPALGAAVGQAEDEPPEWGKGTDGYARRLASGVGRHLIAETIRFGVAAVDTEDPRYRHSDDTGVWNRTRHAIVESFTSRTRSGTRIPAFSRFAGSYGAAFISNLWYPAPRATTGWALRRGSTAFGSSFGFHLLEEFVPRKYLQAFQGQD
jgi:hypothetical protein